MSPHGLQPTRLLRPWDSPGKSTGAPIYRSHSTGTPKFLAPLHLSPFSPPDHGRMVDSPALSRRGSQTSRRTSGQPLTSRWSLVNSSAWLSLSFLICKMGWLCRLEGVGHLHAWGLSEQEQLLLYFHFCGKTKRDGVQALCSIAPRAGQACSGGARVLRWLEQPS